MAEQRITSHIVIDTAALRAWSDGTLESPRGRIASLARRREAKGLDAVTTEQRAVGAPHLWPGDDT